MLFERSLLSQPLSEVCHGYPYLFTLSLFRKRNESKGWLPVKVICFRNKTFLELNQGQYYKIMMRSKNMTKY